MNHPTKDCKYLNNSGERVEIGDNKVPEGINRSNVFIGLSGFPKGFPNRGNTAKGYIALKNPVREVKAPKIVRDQYQIGYDLGYEDGHKKGHDEGYSDCANEYRTYKSNY